MPTNIHFGPEDNLVVEEDAERVATAVAEARSNNAGVAILTQKRPRGAVKVYVNPANIRWFRERSR